MTTPAELSSEKMDWQTPEYFLDLVRRVAPIGLDPCAPAGKNPTGARFAFHQPPTPGVTCGLARSWQGWLAPNETVFANPPYGAHLSGEIDPDHKIMRRPSKGADPVCIGRGIGWARKIVSEREVTRIALVPARPDAEWWHHMFDHADATLLWRSDAFGARLRFVDPETGRTVPGNTAPSTVFLFTDQTEIAGPPVRGIEMIPRFHEVFREHGTLITQA